MERRERVGGGGSVSVILCVCWRGMCAIYLKCQKLCERYFTMTSGYHRASIRYLVCTNVPVYTYVRAFFVVVLVVD